MSDRKLTQQMDACGQPERDLDLADFSELSQALLTTAEAREQFAMIRRIDKRVMTTLHDVPIPTGLESRILAQLETAQPESADPLSAAGPSRSQSLWQRRTHPTQWNRRWMLSGGLATAATVVFMVAGSLRHFRETYDNEQLMRMASQWYEHLDKGEWNDDLSSGKTLRSCLRAAV